MFKDTMILTLFIISLVATIMMIINDIKYEKLKKRFEDEKQQKKDI